jgi:putative PEP-CTERM system histidine kinase
MMYLIDVLPLASFFFCASTCLVVLLRRRWNATALSFFAGMASLAIMQICNYLAINTVTADESLTWKQVGLLGEILLGGSFLVFSIVFAKRDPINALRKGMWTVLPAYAVPGFLLLILSIEGQAIAVGDTNTIIFLPPGKYLNIALLVILIWTLRNLESTFRSSIGTERWRIKYLIFGLAFILLVQVYILSQRLLYNVWSVSDGNVGSAVALVANVLMIYSVVRNGVVDGEIYLSRKIIYTSISLIAIGLYSVVVALSAQILKSFEVQKHVRLDVLLAILAALTGIIVFYKESVRRRIKAIINRNFRKSKYVYQDEWMVFSTTLSKSTITNEICETFLQALCDRIFVKFASLWLADDATKSFHMIGFRNMAPLSTRISFDDKVVDLVFGREHPTGQLEIRSNKELQPLSGAIQTLLEKCKAELLVPLIVAEKWVALLTLGKIQTAQSYDEVEDYGLLRSAAAHAASAINSAMLSEERAKSKEMEAIHRLSTFMLHDLKNVASTLGMVVQNAEKHIHKPEFQRDALSAISEAVGRMKTLISSLSYGLPAKLKLTFKEWDLNEIVRQELEKLAPALEEVRVERELAQIPRVRADEEEMRKVVHNLLLNASEALAEGGRLKVSTRIDDDRVVLSVNDNGSGIEKDFIEKSLFQPFQSTKKKGLGIGLYQCKTIVEAHGGWIDVESEPGMGTTFSVYLPLGGLRQGT